MSLNLTTLIENLHKAQNENNVENIVFCLFELARYHYNDSNFSKAKIILKQIKELNENYAEINYFLALIAFEEEDFNLARKYLELELSLNSNHKMAKVLLEKLQIHNNVPLITILLFLLMLSCFIFTYPQIGLINSVKYGFIYDYFSIFSLFSSIFFHVNIIHFITNSAILLLFGFILEKSIGSIKFLLIFLFSAFIGNLTQGFFYTNSIVLGASGGLFGILGAIIMREPLLELRLLGILKVPIVLVFGGFFALNSIINFYFTYINFNLDFSFGNISHIIGLMCGFLLSGIFYHETIRVFYSWIMIFFGFYLIEFGINNLLLNFQNLNLLVFLMIFFIFAFGYILIVSSYNFLKFSIIMEKEK